MWHSRPGGALSCRGNLFHTENSMPSNWVEKQFEELKKLAEERFAPLSEAETKMLRAAIAGDIAWCGPSEKDDDPHNDPSFAGEMGCEARDSR
jgi:hypothetical protein